MNPIGTARYAREFLEAAKTLKPEPEGAALAFRSDLEISIPVYYLLCHATELALKTILLESGFTESQLAGKDKSRGRFGHDLLALFDEVQKAEVSAHYIPPKSDREIIKLMTPYFVGKKVEYFYQGLSSYPKHSLLLGVASRLVDSAEKMLKK